MRRVGLGVVLTATVLLASCSGSGGTAQLPTTLPATKCVGGPADGSRLITFTVIAPADGSAGLSAVAPSDVTAGPVRIVVEADASNAEVTQLRIASGDAEVVVIRGVAAGDSCAVDLELAAARYTASAGGRSVDFDIQP
ncbi:MAG: hypothetical protein RI900_1548 [Actinomycetota bacterium]